MAFSSGSLSFNKVALFSYFGNVFPTWSLDRVPNCIVYNCVSTKKKCFVIPACVVSRRAKNSARPLEENFLKRRLRLHRENFSQTCMSARAEISSLVSETRLEISTRE